MQSNIKTERLTECRKKLHLTQADAAELIGVTQPAYQRYEAGTRTPSIQVVKEMAKAFNVSVDYLTGNTKNKSPDFITVDKNTSPLLFSVVDHCQGYDEEHLKALLEMLESQNPD